MTWWPRYGPFMVSAMLSFAAHAADGANSSPQAGARTYAQNFKDMVLATCITQAYRNDPEAAKDAGSSISALRDWTAYDMEMSPDAIKTLVDIFLRRDYSNPLAESEIKGVKFDFLKCMDLYHSKALEDMVKQLVIHPNRRYRQEQSSRTRAPSGPAK